MALRLAARPPVGSDSWIEELRNSVIASEIEGDFPVLGRGLAQRVDDALALIEARDNRLADDVLLEARRARRRVAVLLIARWLVTEQRSEPEELAWIDELGGYSVVHRSGLESSMDGYYAWRDATIAIIREEGAKHEVPVASREKAVEMVRRSCDATVKRMAGSFDAHRLKQARLLEESERQIRTIFATMPCGGCLVDSDNRIALANQAAADLLRLPLDRLRGMHVRQLTKDMKDQDGGPLRSPLSELARETGTPQAPIFAYQTAEAVFAGCRSTRRRFSTARAPSALCSSSSWT